MGEAASELCTSVYPHAPKSRGSLRYFSRIVTESEITPS
jgi:hypothetical protein